MLGYGLQNRSLLGGDGLDRTHAREMRAAGERDDRAFRLDDLGERQDLARIAHADFGHQKLRLVGSRKQRERHADVVVETLRACVGRTRFAEDALEKPTRCGLARAASHGNHTQLENTSPPCVRQRAQRSPR